jgi:hypothetical protein
MTARFSAAVEALWPATNLTKTDSVNRAAALSLLGKPQYSSPSSVVSREVLKALGLQGQLHDLGMSWWADLFAGSLGSAPAVFMFTAGPTPHEACITLNTQGLLQVMAQQWQQQHKQKQQEQQKQQAPEPPPTPPL